MTDTTPPTGRPINDMRQLYAVQHAITDAGGTLTPDVHKAIDALRELWDAGLRRAQAEAIETVRRMADQIAAAELRRMADEAQQTAVVTTVERAATRGMTDTEYRAASHRAAVEAVRAAAKGMYAEVGLRVMDALSEAQQPETQAEVVHACPPDGSGITPCCGRTPFELPRTDRMSVDSTLITCQPAAVSQPGKEA